MYGRQRQRRRPIKSTLTYDGRRRKRSERMVTLRKQRREELRKKRRREMSALYPDEVRQMMPHMPEAVAKLRSNDPRAQLEGVEFFRKILSAEDNPPIDHVIRAGTLPSLVSFISRSDNGKLQFEALWAITNICSGTEDHLKLVLTHNIMPVLIHCLQSPHPEVRIQAVWCIGNVAGEGIEYRDFCLRYPVVSAVLNVLQHPNASLTLIQNAVWSLTNLSRGDPTPPFERFHGSFAALCNILSKVNDQEAMCNAAWALSYLIQGDSKVSIPMLISLNIVPRLVELLGSGIPGIVMPCTSILGDLTTGSDSQTDVPLRAGLLRHLPRILANANGKLLKESLWLTSNLCSGTNLQLQGLLDSGTLQTVCRLLTHQALRVRLESAWCIANAASTATDQQLKQIIDFGILPPFIGLLTTPEPTLLLVVMEGIEHILSKGARIQRTAQLPSNPYVALAERSDCEDKLQALQCNHDQRIYNLSEKLLERFFADARRPSGGGAGGSAFGTDDYDFEQDFDADDYDFGDDELSDDGF